MLENIKGTIRVFKKDFKHEEKVYSAYSTCISKAKPQSDAKADKEYIKAYLSIDFSKAMEKKLEKVNFDGGVDMIINKAWLTPVSYKDDTSIHLFINDAKLVL